MAQGPRKVLRVRVEREGGRKPLEAVWGGISLAHKRFGVGVTLNDDPAVFRKGQRSELVRRLLAGSCELCGSRDGVSAHHIRRLADLPRTAEGGSSPWAEQMAKHRRKSLIVCLACHESIHNSRSTRHDPRNKALESRVR